MLIVEKLGKCKLMEIRKNPAPTTQLGIVNIIFIIFHPACNSAVLHRPQPSPNQKF